MRVRSMRPYRQIALVSNEHDGHVGVGMLPRVFQPAGQVVECLAPAQQQHGQRVESSREWHALKATHARARTYYTHAHAYTRMHENTHPHTHKKDP